MNIPQHSGDFSETSFYPSCVVHLRVRLDTSYTYRVPDPRSGEDLAAGTIKPLFTEQGDGYSRLNGIIPMKATVEMASYRKGARFSFLVAFRDFPIDPRLIKAASVKIYAGTVSAAAFAAGISQASPTTLSERLYFNRRSLVEATDDNMLVSGPVDVPKFHVSDSIGELSFEGRDYVATLADPTISPKLLAKLDVTKSIDNVVGQILASHPLVTERKIDPFIVGAQPDDWPRGVIPSPGDKDGLTRVRQRANGGGAMVHPGADPGSSVSYWDLIVNYCQLVAAIPYFSPEGMLLVRPAVGLHDWQWAERNFNPKIKVPFAGNIPRTIDDGRGGGREISYRRMVYGRNIDDLTFERKIGGVKARVVQVWSLDDDADGRGSEQKLIHAEFPPDGLKNAGSAKSQGSATPKASRAAVSSVTPEGDKASTDVVRITVHGIRDKKRLAEIAEGVFNEIMHQEITGHIQTKALTSFGGNNGDPDLLRLRVGDPMQILTDAAAFNANAPHVSVMLDQARRSFEEEVRVIRERVANDENFARAIVATARNLVPGLQNTFRTAGIKFDFDMTGTPSVQINADFQNYVEVQYSDVNRKPDGAATTAPTRTRI